MLTVVSLRSFVDGRARATSIIDQTSLTLLLTQADVVVEKGQEVVTLFPVVAASNAGAPGSHVGCGVVQVVGGDCASCSGKSRTGKEVLYLYS